MKSLTISKRANVFRVNCKLKLMRVHLLTDDSSLKDLIKAISKVAPELSLPLPVSLQDAISAYLEKHSSDDDLESENLQDELLAVYQSRIKQNPSNLAGFLAVLQRLKIFFRNSKRLLQLWSNLLDPFLMHLGRELKLANKTKDILLEIIVYDDDGIESRELENIKATSFVVAEILLASWLTKTKEADEELSDHAGFVAGHIQLILIEYGKKLPKVCMKLPSFFRHQPPHLHQMLLTPLFKNLLRCLQFDTSTRAVSLAMTALVMFLPHIPCISSQHLPALFNIYTRMLFWDRVRRSDRPSSPEDGEISSDVNEKYGVGLPNVMNTDDETVPELLHYFTFLYGLYPINFMSYIQKPQKYLSHSNYLGIELDIQPIEVRQRSEPFRKVHLLHPNFFTLTMESELTDENRWIKSDAADVVAECMALYVPREDLNQKTSKSNTITMNSQIAAESMYDEENTSCQPGWPDVQSSDHSCDISLAQNQDSQSVSLAKPIRDSSGSLRSSEIYSLSTIIPPDTHSWTTYHKHSTANSLSSSIFQKKLNVSKYMHNDSVASLALSNHHESQSGSYPPSMNHDDLLPSPLLYSRSTGAPTSDMRVAYLYREVQLLRNVLNFERYLKQQHLSHIGHLRRKQIREARIEAETQSIITSNRTLKLKLEEKKRLNTQLKSESEKSKTHWRKWEAELSAKLRSLREDQRNWKSEKQQLTQELKGLKETEITMKQIITMLETNDLKQRQKATHLEISLEELERLRREVKELNHRVQILQVNEHAAKTEKENDVSNQDRITILEAQIMSRDQDLITARKLFEEEISSVRKQVLDTQVTRKIKNVTIQEIIDSALVISRARITELQKNYNQLHDRYTALQEQHFGLQDKMSESENINDNDSAITASKNSGLILLDHASGQDVRKDDDCF